MNHTPGKWSVQQIEDSHHGYADWPTFAIRDHRNICIAIVGEVDHYDSVNNAKRANLIASATELYAVAKRIEYALRMLPELPATISSLDMELLSKAIAKAEGRTS